MTKTAMPRRGEVWMASLDPTVGHEVRKTRPALIVTNDLYNKPNWVVLVVPLTSHSVAEYDQIPIVPPKGGLTQSSVTLPDQLRAVDRSRLVKRLGRLKTATMAKVD